jgi:hypothetical protein
LLPQALSKGGGARVDVDCAAVVALDGQPRGPRQDVRARFPSQLGDADRGVPDIDPDGQHTRASGFQKHGHGVTTSALPDCRRNIEQRQEQ